MLTDPILKSKVDSLWDMFWCVPSLSVPLHKGEVIISFPPLKGGRGDEISQTSSFSPLNREITQIKKDSNKTSFPPLKGGRGMYE
jgi:hypothetical protein